MAAVDLSILTAQVDFVNAVFAVVNIGGVILVVYCVLIGVRAVLRVVHGEDDCSCGSSKLFNQIDGDFLFF